MDDLLRRAEALLHYAAELESRAAASGPGDVDLMLAQWDRLRAALEPLDAHQLEGAREELDGLITALDEMAQRLERLRELKQSLTGES